MKITLPVPATPARNTGIPQPNKLFRMLSGYGNGNVGVIFIGSSTVQWLHASGPGYDLPSVFERFSATWEYLPAGETVTLSN